MLDFTEASLKKVLTRYNVALEKAMTPEEAAEELYPKTNLFTRSQSHLRRRRR